MALVERMLQHQQLGADVMTMRAPLRQSTDAEYNRREAYRRIETLFTAATYGVQPPVTEIVIGGNRLFEQRMHAQLEHTLNLAQSYKEADPRLLSDLYQETAAYHLNYFKQRRKWRKYGRGVLEVTNTQLKLTQIDYSPPRYGSLWRHHIPFGRTG